jgi:RND family efflux transporter MFP subunit
VARERTARAARVEAETMLGYARVVAPFDGVIVRKLADVGDLAAPGRSLLELEDPGRLRLEADVPESFIGRLSQGQRLVAGFGTPVVSTECTVSEIAPVSDPASRTFLVKLDLPPGAGVRAGQFGRLAVPLAAAPGIRIPAPALVVRGQMEMVFTAEKGVARMRLVRSGRRSGGEVEILSGLSAGETVVMSGADGLLDGRPLEVRP